MSQKYGEEFSRIREELTRLNQSAKEEMLICLAKCAKKDDINQCVNGFETLQIIGANQTEVIMRFNCRSDGTGSKRVGAGINDLKHYRWIPVVCRIGEDILNYRIDILCQDIDTNTGNFHIDALGNLQIWGGLKNFSTSEVGGSIAEIKPFSEKYDTTSENQYILNRFAKSYPKSIRAERKAFYSPWGYDEFDCPTLDMADDDFDMQKAADFFWKLIITDIEENNEIRIKNIVK